MRNEKFNDGKITLFNCSKADVKNFIKRLQHNMRGNWLYVGLQDKYTEDAWFWISTDDDKEHNRFFSLGCITTGKQEAKELGILPSLLIPDDGGEHVIPLDELVDYLYDYIVENYQ